MHNDLDALEGWCKKAKGLAPPQCGPLNLRTDNTVMPNICKSIQETLLIIGRDSVASSWI